MPLNHHLNPINPPFLPTLAHLFSFPGGMRVRIVPVRQRRDVLPRAATQRWNAEELPREDDAVETTAGGGFQGVVENISDTLWWTNIAIENGHL